MKLGRITLDDLEQKRKKLCDLYSTALGDALMLVDNIQAAMDRLVEIDEKVIDYMAGS